MARAISWTIAGAGIARATAFISLILVASIIDVESFGEYIVLQSTLLTMTAIGGFGISISANKRISEAKNEKEMGGIMFFSLAMSLGVATAILFAALFFSSYICGHILQAPGLEYAFGLTLISLIPQSVSGPIGGILSARKENRALSLCTITAGVVGSAVAVLGAALSGINGAIVGGIIGNFTFLFLGGSVIARMPLARSEKILGLTALSEFSKIISHNIPLAICSLLHLPVNWLCILILARSPMGYSEIGIFGFANQLYAMLIFIPGALLPVIIPHISVDGGHGIVSAASKYRREIFGALLGIALPLAAFTSLLIEWFGGQYSAAAGIAFLCVITAVFYGLGALLGAVNIVKGNNWMNVWLNLLWAVVFLALTCLLTPILGALGLALGRLAAQAAHVLSSILSIRTGLRRSN